MGFSLTFKTGALLPPVDTKATQSAEFTTGKVIVTRCGGGLGESLIGATVFFVSCILGTNNPIFFKYKKRSMTSHFYSIA